MTHEGSVPRKPHVGISKAEAANKQGLHLSQEAACQQGKNSWPWFCTQNLQGLLPV